MVRVGGPALDAHGVVVAVLIPPWFLDGYCTPYPPRLDRCLSVRRGCLVPPLSLTFLIESRRTVDALAYQTVGGRIVSTSVRCGWGCGCNFRCLSDRWIRLFVYYHRYIYDLRSIHDFSNIFLSVNAVLRLITTFKTEGQKSK